MQAALRVLTSIVILLGLASCGKDEDKKATDSPIITDFNEVVKASDRTTLVGRSVAAENVSVDAIVGTYVFWAGENHSAVPVFRKDKADGKPTEPVRVGGRVRLSGKVRAVENLEITHPLWDHVNEQEKQDIRNAKVFVEADSVQNLQ